MCFNRLPAAAQTVGRRRLAIAAWMRGMQQGGVVEVVARVVQRGGGFAIADEQEAARHMLQKAGEILGRCHRLAIA